MNLPKSCISVKKKKEVKKDRTFGKSLQRQTVFAKRAVAKTKKKGLMMQFKIFVQKLPNKKIRNHKAMS